MAIYLFIYEPRSESPTFYYCASTLGKAARPRCIDAHEIAQAMSVSANAAQSIIKKFDENDDGVLDSWHVNLSELDMTNGEITDMSSESKL